jgi:hypothetical protein
MNAYFLHKPDGTKTDLSACGVCGKLARGVTNFDISEKCCTCYDCGKPLGEERYVSNIIYCRNCDSKRRAKVEADRLEKATVLENYDGPVFWDGGHGSYGEGYYENADELSEDDDFEGEYAYACTSRCLILDLDNVLENLCEEMHEDAIDDLNGVEQLQAAVNVFNEANKSVLTYDVDYKHKVRIERTA